jgi:hypothetical protein
MFKKGDRVKIADEIYVMRSYVKGSVFDLLEGVEGTVVSLVNVESSYVLWDVNLWNWSPAAHPIMWTSLQYAPQQAFWLDGGKMNYV